jgi:hypothetical protein
MAIQKSDSALVGEKLCNLAKDSPVGARRRGEIFQHRECTVIDNLSGNLDTGCRVSNDEDLPGAGNQLMTR